MQDEPSKKPPYSQKTEILYSANATESQRTLKSAWKQKPLNLVSHQKKSNF